MENKNQDSYQNQSNLNNQSFETKRPSADHKKTTLILLIIAGVAVLFFGYLSMKNDIYSHFKLVPVDDGNELDSVDVFNERFIDTDGDGLSDYDEKYVYGTSPYLWDTDSDGVSDKEEIMRGTDPNCAGENCAVISPPVNAGTFGANYNVNSSTVIDDPLLGKIDIENLRQVLYDSGLKESIINSFSDEELYRFYLESSKGSSIMLESYYDSLEKYGGLEEAEKLKSLTNDEIREMLIRGGAPRESVEQIPDEEIRQTYNEYLIEQGIIIEE